MREYYSGYFFGKVTLNFNLKKKILTKHQHSKYVLFLLATSSLVIWENEPMVIRCKFLVISYLFWVGGIHLSAKQKKKRKRKLSWAKKKPETLYMRQLTYQRKVCIGKCLATRYSCERLSS